MMGDTTYFILFKADFTNMKQIKGQLKYKCQHKFILSTTVEKQDSNRLNLTIQRDCLDDSPQFGDKRDINSPSFNTDIEEISLYFEDKMKCNQTRQFIDYNRSNGE